MRIAECAAIDRFVLRPIYDQELVEQVTAENFSSAFSFVYFAFSTATFVLPVSATPPIM